MFLEQIVEEGARTAKEVTGVELQQSTIKVYSHSQWLDFCRANNFVEETNGVYVPAGRSAYVQKSSPTITSDVFHELFGHGLFYEHSTIGHKLAEVIKKEKDQKEFFEKEKRIDDEGFFNNFYWDYEGFATWLEARLCKETNNEAIWKKKKQQTHPMYLRAKEQLEDVEKNITLLGLLSQFGFPKTYSDEQVVEAAKKLYRQTFENIDFLLLRGSQKPYSDIDLFTVSRNQTQNHDLRWIDIYEVNNQEFETLRKLFDISITDPLIQGKIIHGNKEYFERAKKELYTQPITRDAIEHNLRRSYEQETISKQLLEGSPEQRTALGYANSFRANAQQLREGHKALTLAKLEEIYGPLRT